MLIILFSKLDHLIIVIIMLYLTVVDCHVNHSFLKVGPFDDSNSHFLFHCSGLSC